MTGSPRHDAAAGVTGGSVGVMMDTIVPAVADRRAARQTSPMSDRITTTTTTRPTI